MYSLTITHTHSAPLKALAIQAQEQMPDAKISLGLEMSWQPPADTGEEHIMKIVDVLEPRPADDHGYWGFWLSAAGGDDSWNMSKGEKDFSPRPHSKKITDRLRKFFSPSECISKEEIIISKQIHFPDGAYKGVRYQFTPLGRQVFDEMDRRRKLLKEAGLIDQSGRVIKPPKAAGA